MKKTLLLTGVVAAILFVSCKPEEPKDVLATYLEKANHGEFEEAAKYIDKKSVSGVAVLSMTPVSERLKMMQQDVDVEVTSEDIKDSVAYLKVKLTIDGKAIPESGFALKKEEGEWKVIMSERFEAVREAYNASVDSTTLAAAKDSLR
ncbi:MAG: hypothetical protein ACLGH8_12335 [Bacteroidia bacterium]